MESVPVAETMTHCPYCALQCGMSIRPGKERLDVAPRNFPTNRGGLCRKGWTAADLLRSPERLTTPLMRSEPWAPLRPVPWDLALERMTRELSTIRRESGPDAIAVFGGGGLTNEKAYQLGKFARVVLGTSKIDYNGRFCMSSAAAAGIRAFGLDRGIPFPLSDLAETEVLVLAGTNVAETMPPLMGHLASQRDRGGALIVIDPRRTRTAEGATLHLQPSPGTDLALANGLLHLAIVEGHLDPEFINSRTSGFSEVRRSMLTYWPERVERITGVPVAELRRAVRLIGRANSAVILTGRGVEQHSKGVDTVTAFINLALALGLPGRPASGCGWLTGQGNGQGGREHGQKADQLPGYRRIDDPSARAHVASVWGVEPDSLPGPGLAASELLASLGTPGGPRALLVFGSNIVVSAPTSMAVQSSLDSVEFLVVADVVLSETARRADVVLPVAQWAEEDGTLTNLEGRVIRRRRAVPPPPQVRTDLEVLADLADRMGHGSEFSADPRAVFEELCRASAGGPADYSGMDWARIDSEEELYWPCPASSDASPALGSPRPFSTRFATPDGRARFVAVEHRDSAEEPDVEFPLKLTTGRVLAHYQSGAQTRRIDALRTAVPEPLIEIHPATAAQFDVCDGEWVQVVSRRGRASGRARLTDSARLDTVFMPFHWPGEQSANLVTNSALDPISRMPEFKTCAIRLERVNVR